MSCPHMVSQRQCCHTSCHQLTQGGKGKKKVVQRQKRESSQLSVDDNPFMLDLSSLGENNKDTSPQPRKSPRLNRPESSGRSSEFGPKPVNLKTPKPVIQRPKSAKVTQLCGKYSSKHPMVRPHSSVSKPHKLTEDGMRSCQRPGTAPLIKVTEPLPAWSETELLEAIEKASLCEQDDLQSLISNIDASDMSTHRSYTPSDDKIENDEEEEEEERPLKDPIKKMMEIPAVDDNAYDTDLEDEFSAGPPKDYDSTGRTIYLEQCQAEGVDPISFVLRNFHQPKLRLRHRYMAARDVKPLAQALGCNSCIEDLDLNDNHLTEEGAIAIAIMMRNNNYIHKLDLSDNLIGRKGVAAMAYMLESNYTLKKLCLSGNHLRDCDGAILANGLRSNGTLTELDLSYNEFGESGGLNIGLALAANDGLVYLDLRWNSLRGKGVLAIANALKVNTSLEVLDLSKNAVALPGCMALMRSLKVNTGLRILNLSHNHVNPQATQKLSLALKKNNKLEVLMLNCNPVGDEGIIALLKALVVNSSLKLLNLMGYSVSKTVQQKLREIQEDRDVCILCRDPQHADPSSKDSIITVSVVNQFITMNQTQVIDKCYLVDEERSGFISTTQLITSLLDAGIDVRKSDLIKVLKMLKLEDAQKISYRHILKGLSSLCQDY